MDGFIGNVASSGFFRFVEVLPVAGGTFTSGLC